MFPGHNGDNLFTRQLRNIVSICGREKNGVYEPIKPAYAVLLVSIIVSIATVTGVTGNIFRIWDRVVQQRELDIFAQTEEKMAALSPEQIAEILLAREEFERVFPGYFSDIHGVEAFIDNDGVRRFHTMVIKN